jgi:hypothetical protein
MMMDPNSLERVLTNERRYRDEEIAHIFDAAATPLSSRVSPGPSPSSGEGLTLAELQDIGREVGVSPERIVEAASALDHRRALPRRTNLGMPISVGRSVELPRAPTDREWGMLVAELRETFNAQGREGSRGDLREWSNGNLSAHIEPTEGGYRLRLRTLKGDGLATNRVGISILLVALLILGLALFEGGDDTLLQTSLFFGLMGAGVLGFNALRLQGWAREREEQMDNVAARARALIGRDPRS